MAVIESEFSITAGPDLKDDTADIHYVPAPCQVACPIGTDAPSYIAYIWEGKNEEALEAINATNPFSAICGRVCDAPCEPACRRADSDGAIAIRNLKRYVLETLGPGFALPPVAVTREKTIGIVGAGPAGMTAAHDLAEAGYEVHLYEATDQLGGMMFWGIPRFRLPQAAVQQDIDRITGHCPGIKIHLNSALGEQVSLDELKQKHEVVLLALGAFVGKPMGVPGEAAPYVEDGVSFLYRVNAGERPTLPETVLVVGGGDVAMDACRVAKRLPGVKNVKVIYRRDYEAMPARREELQGAIDEGIEIVYNTQPVEVIDGRALRCVRTELGEPDEDGRSRPINIEGSEHDIECGMVIAAVGQKTECAELETAGLMDWDRVRTNFEGMATSDPRVFAAGDGAFGGSTIVEAMYQGHRAAYYLKAYLEGNDSPLPYRTPYRTRRVPICNDPDWEINPRVHQQFHGLGQVPIEFPEIESTYSAAEAKAEAARCFRCDAETGSADYTVGSRESIFAMARINPNDLDKQTSILESRLDNRENPFTEEHVATLDDLVFLPANLSRLVIDPYREGCVTATRFGAIQSLKLDIPFTVTGLDDAPSEIRESVARSIVSHGAAYIGAAALGEGSPWIQIVTENVDPTANAIVFNADQAMAAGEVSRASAEQPAGLVVNAANVQAAVDFGLAHHLDFLLLDPTNDLPGLAGELAGAPDIGLRTGTDAAKILALGAIAVTVGAAMALALGADISDGKAVFNANLDAAEREQRSSNLLQAFTAESTMMARCTGKTNVQNLEPEDLRAITLVVSHAAGVPMAGSLNQH
jgi:NADPH-dependent glutamate synthase beta subunit-like oxidoreductase